MGEIIRFTDDRFLELFKKPVKYNNRRFRLIYKAYEIYYNIKEKENANNRQNNKRK